MLSPRLATYKALPGGATVVSDGSGALGASGVEGREVRNNLGFAVWAEAGETAARKAKFREMNRMAASDVGPD